MRFCPALVLAALVAAGCSATQTATAPSAVSADATARYRVTFQATWSSATHPVDFPSAHFSALVGGTHNALSRFWAEGAPASAGIRDMAERGRTTPLDQEIRAAIAAGTAEHLLLGAAIDASPGSVSLEFQISSAYPLITLVSMIAPSPDWFVGVSGQPLIEDGQWIESRRIDLVPWDAGTDSGSTFTSPDRVTMPPQPISRIVTAPLSPDGRVTPLGTFTFTRVPE